MEIKQLKKKLNGLKRFLIMAVFLIVLAAFFIFIAAMFVLGVIGQNKVFLSVAFFLLMLTGVLVWSSDGVIVKQNISSVDKVTGAIHYEDVILDSTNPLVYIFNFLSIFIGGIMGIYSFFTSGIKETKREETFYY